MKIFIAIFATQCVLAAGFSQVTPTPDVLWGPLFTQVQLQRVLGDNKTFVDAIPKYEPSFIKGKYINALRNDSSFNLHQFVVENFILPSNPKQVSLVKSNSLKEHLEKQWNTLVRKADVKQAHSSLLPLPKPYIVPGGRFREIYYWDSYFTMLGLAVSNRYDLIESMLDNFAYLVNTYGHIPNGNRNYYLSRSQPPYFALMVELLQQKKGASVYKKYLPALEKEYAFWMDGEKQLKPNEAYRHLVNINGTVLNRYWDDEKKPRQESYYEDVQTALATTNKDGLIYTHLRAGAESGWDFSSRWFEDTMHLTTIETLDIIPVDLNCLLYAYEQVLAKALRSNSQIQRANQINSKAKKRKQDIIKYCWNEQLQCFFDYDWKQQTTTNKYSLAAVLPLFTKVASKEQASGIKNIIEQKFLKDGGLVTTTYNTGQQWDAPNGWAPLQYLAVSGLMHYNYNELAQKIATRWMHLNEKVYAGTGKMLEKYNVENINLPGGGGEYPTQDGFGWTNGVYLKFYDLFRKTK
jgi:alpha,alpha-trehalase